MNPYDSPATAGRVDPSPGSFRDRRTALTVFGVLEILLGALFLLLAVASVAGQALSARILEQEPNYLQALPSALLYAILAGAMIYAGLGSMAPRRFAVNLTLILGGSWLLTGALSLAVMAYSLPRIFGSMPEMEAAPEGMPGVLLAVTLGVAAIFLVVLPGVLVLFYRSRHVKATVLAYDRGEDWTSACPLPVLTVSLWTLAGAVLFFASAIALNGAMPLFGIVVTGVPGMLVYFALAAVWAYAAWGLYRLSAAGWWSIFLSSLFLGVSALVTFLRMDPISMYAYMGYSEEQIEALRQMSTLTGVETAWITTAVLVPFLAYLVYLRKHFRSQDAPAAGALGES